MKKVSLNPAVVAHTVAVFSFKGFGAVKDEHEVSAGGRALKSIRKSAKRLKHRWLRAQGRSAVEEGLAHG